MWRTSGERAHLLTRVPKSAEVLVATTVRTIYQ